MKIGYKVNGLWQPQYAPIGHQLPVSVIVDSMLLARSLATQNKIVIHRYTDLNGTKDEGYGSWHRSIGTSAYADLLASAHGEFNKDIWMYVLNEPNTSNIQEQREMLRFVEETGRKLVSRGFKVVVLNTPPASWRADWIEAGTADALLSWASQNRNNVIIGYHDYSECHLVAFGNGERNYERFGEQSYVAMSNWAKDVNPDTAWHIGHITRLIRRARQLRLNPRIGCTELNYGEVQDHNTLSARIRLAQQFPPSPQIFMRDGIQLHNGQHTLHGYWRAMYPNMKWEQVVIEQLKWYSQVLGGLWGVEFATLYAFGFGAEHGQDYWNDHEFHRQLIAWQNKTPPTPPPTRQAYIRSNGNYRVRVRNSPSTNGKIIGMIGSRPLLVWFYETVNGWHKIDWHGQIGYVSAQFSILQ